MEGTFRRANRLRSSGYPSNLLVIVAEDFINEFRNTSDNLKKKKSETEGNGHPVPAPDLSQSDGGGR